MYYDIDTLILRALKNNKLSGLEIIEDIKQQTNNEIVLNQPSLYSNLRRLESKGYVESFWEDGELGSKKHFYNITNNGENLLNISSNTDNISPIVNEKPTVKNEQKIDDDNEDDNDLELDLSILDDLLEKDFEDDSSEQEDSSNKDETNYKDILGDYLEDEDDNDINNEFKNSSMYPSKKENDPARDKSIDDIDIETQKILEKSRAYAKEMADLFSSNNKNPFEQFFEPTTQEQGQMSEKGIQLLEEISKRHKKLPTYLDDMDEMENKENTNKDIPNPIKPKDNSSLNYSTEKTINKTTTNVNFTPISRTDTKYILINKVNKTSQIALTIYNFIITIGFAIFYLVNGLFGLEQYIIIGCGLIFIVLSTFIVFAQYYKYKDKKINKKYKTKFNLLAKILLTLLIIAFIISINLLLGMTNWFEPINLLRWLFPTLLTFNITIRHIINKILMKKINYQI